MEYILRTNTVSKKYTNYYAVDKVSISIKKGEIYGLIGENGAGKSTLMKMIMISSHILGELSKIATKYGIIKNGKLNEEITAKELNEKCQCCLKIKAWD